MPTILMKDKLLHSALCVVFLVAGCVLLGAGHPIPGLFLLAVSAAVVWFGVVAVNSEA
jgi:hypothetical protein